MVHLKASPKGDSPYVFDSCDKLGTLGSLRNKNQNSPASYDFSICKLSKSNTLPFPNFGSCVTKCFNVNHSGVWGISPIISHVHF